jgi:hypothetical protein
VEPAGEGRVVEAGEVAVRDIGGVEGVEDALRVGVREADDAGGHVVGSPGRADGCQPGADGERLGDDLDPDRGEIALDLGRELFLAGREPEHGDASVPTGETSRCGEVRPGRVDVRGPVSERPGRGVVRGAGAAEVGDVVRRQGRAVYGVGDGLAHVDVSEQGPAGVERDPERARGRVRVLEEPLVTDPGGGAARPEAGAQAGDRARRKGSGVPLVGEVVGCARLDLARALASVRADLVLDRGQVVRPRAGVVRVSLQDEQPAGRVERTRRMRTRPQLEHRRRQTQPLDRSTHRPPLHPQLAQRGAHEHA